MEPHDPSAVTGNDQVSDPVCGHPLNSDRAVQTYAYHDQIWYFDSAECFRRFLEDPEKYADPPAEINED